MKTFKLTFLLLALLSVAACNDDDDNATPVCEQSDWVGTYTGTEDCNDSDIEDATITITASGTDAIIISYASGSVTTTFDPIVFNGCNLSQSGTDQGITVSADATLDGNVITLNTSFSVGGTASTCTITGTRN